MWFFDARGHLEEPHTNHVVDLGTLGVRNYLSDEGEPDFTLPDFQNLKIKTKGPDCRYGAILFIEKEGFMPLFKAVKLAERYDIAIMSSKGQATVATRHVVDELCSKHQIPLLVLHDFDIAGFSILGCLSHDTDRYTFSNIIQVIDLGLNLDDVEKYSLPTEDVYIREDKLKLTWTLRANGATEEDIDFLMDNQRVELNAFTSDQFIDFIEGKLEEHNIKKVIPDDHYLEQKFRHAAQASYLEEHMQEIKQEAIEYGSAVEIPSSLRESVKEVIEDNKELSWDRAVDSIFVETSEDENRLLN